MFACYKKVGDEFRLTLIDWGRMVVDEKVRSFLELIFETPSKAVNALAKEFGVDPQKILDFYTNNQIYLGFDRSSWDRIWKFFGCVEVQSEEVMEKVLSAAVKYRREHAKPFDVFKVHLVGEAIPTNIDKAPKEIAPLLESIETRINELGSFYEEQLRDIKREYEQGQQFLIGKIIGLMTGLLRRGWEIDSENNLVYRHPIRAKYIKYRGYLKRIDHLAHSFELKGLKISMNGPFFFYYSLGGKHVNVEPLGEGICLGTLRGEDPLTIMIKLPTVLETLNCDSMYNERFDEELNRLWREGILIGRIFHQSSIFEEDEEEIPERIQNPEDFEVEAEEEYEEDEDYYYSEDEEEDEDGRENTGEIEQEDGEVYIFTPFLADNSSTSDSPQQIFRAEE